MRRLSLWLVPIGFTAAFVAWPVGGLLLKALHRQGGIASAAPLERLGMTVALSLAGTLGAVAIGLPSAYVLGRLRWPGRSLVRALAMVPFVLPTVVVAAAFSALFGRSGALGGWGMDQTPFAIVCALVFYNSGVLARVVAVSWESLDPSTTLAAHTLGASRARAFLHVTLPALRSSILSAALLVFLFCSTSFGVVLVLGGTRVATLETEVSLQAGVYLNMRAAAVLSLIQLALVGLTLALANRAGRRGSDAASRRAITGSRPAHKRDIPTLIGVLALLAAINVPPVAALVERALRTPHGYGLDHFAALFSNAPPATLAVPVWRAGLTSLTYGLAATAIAAVVAISITAIDSRSRSSRTLEAIATAPLGISAVTLGLGYLVVVRPAFGSSGWLLACAQAVVVLPLVLRSILPVARAIDPRLLDAARSLGAAPWRVAVHVGWPLVRAACGVGLGLGFAVALGEFGAASFLARPGEPTLPTVIAKLLSHPGLENAGLGFAASVALGAVASLTVLATERTRSRLRVAL